MKRYLLCLLALPLSLGGCILSDDAASFYIQDDGRVDLVVLQDNIRSSEPGEKGAKEESDWLSKFKSGVDPESEKLRKSGAKKIGSELLRDTPPYSVVVHGSYDSVEEFGKYFDLNAGKDSGTLKKIKKRGVSSLVFHLPPPEPGKAKQKNAEKPGASRSGPYPILKFVPVGGKVTAADGFRVTEDSGACILDLEAVLGREDRPGGNEMSFSWVKAGTSPRDHR